MKKLLISFYHVILFVNNLRKIFLCISKIDFYYKMKEAIFVMPVDKKRPLM